jgi:hypothetical integral membrane protein (TIGR02206 family)
MKYFLTAPESVPAGHGFGLFSLQHLGMLIALFYLGYKLSNAYLTSPNRDLFRKRLALVIFAMEVIMESLRAVTGQWTAANLPLHLCGWGIFIILFDAFVPNKFTKQLLYALTLPGAAAALLTPDWASAPLVNYFALHSFVIHTLLVTYVIMRMRAHDFRPSFRELWKPVAFLLVVIPMTMIFNANWGTNFFFLSIPAPGSPLEPIHNIFGNFYLLGMCLLLGFVWVLMYTPWLFVHQKSYKNA